MSGSSYKRGLEISTHEITLNCRRISKGRVKGEALVTRQPMGFFGGVDELTGLVTDKNHELRGRSVTDRILVFPVAKGSAGGSYALGKMVSHQTGPAGIINLRADPILAVSAIIANVPMVVVSDEKDLEKMQTGDHVELDADNCLIQVRRP